LILSFKSGSSVLVSIICASRICSAVGWKKKN
jgi:hypothetical protein